MMRARMPLFALLVILCGGCSPEPLTPAQREEARLSARYRHMLQQRKEAQQIANIRAYYKARGVNVN